MQAELPSCYNVASRRLELRSIRKTNVLDLTDLQVAELKSLFDRNGITLSAIGSPIGKIKINEPFWPHMKRFERGRLSFARSLAHRSIRVFSYYLTDGAEWDDSAPRCARSPLGNVQAGHRGRGALAS